MNNLTNLEAVSNYRAMLEENNCLKDYHPGLQRMQELSAEFSGPEPTAITRLEIHKECHILAEDLYRLTGSKTIFTQVQRIGNMLLTRLMKNSEKSTGINR